MNNYESFIIKCFKESEYILGKELNDALRQKFQFTSAGYERKILQRAVENNIISSSEPLTFGNGQFVYLKKGTFLNKEMVLNITKVNRPGLYRILRVLDINRGIMSKHEALKLAAAPLDYGKTKSDSIEKIFSELEALGLVKEITSDNGSKFIIYPSLQKDANTYITIQTERLVQDCVFLPDVLRSLSSLNLIDNNNILYRNRLTPTYGISHNNYTWDALAYTKTTGLSNLTSNDPNYKEKQTLIVFDIIVNREYTDYDLQGFYSRIQSTINSVKNSKRKLIPIVVYSGLESKKLLNTIKKLGFLSFDLVSVFGTGIHGIISNIKTLKVYEDENNGSHIKVVEDTLKKIYSSGQENNLRTIRGDLFEYMILHVLKLIYPATHIEHGKILKNLETKENYEYDFIVINQQLKEVIIIEVKGYSKSNYISLGDSETKNSLKWFFRKTFPFAQKHLKTNYKDYTFRACYITTSGFKEDGIQFLLEINKGALKSKMLDTWYDGAKLMSLLEDNRAENVKSMIKRYFISKDDYV